MKKNEKDSNTIINDVFKCTNIKTILKLEGQRDHGIFFVKLKAFLFLKSKIN